MINETIIPTVVSIINDDIIIVGIAIAINNTIIKSNKVYK